MAASWSALVRAARLLAPDPASAEDLVQSALLKTYAKWRSVDDAGAYTRTVMARLALRAGRRRWRGEMPTGDVPDLLAADDTGPVDAADAMRRYLAALPAEQRAVLVLRFYCDFSEAQIAAALGCSPGTVKSRASRALATLRATTSLRDLEVTDEWQ